MNSYFENAGDLELYRTSLDIHRKETLDSIFHTWRKNRPEWKRFFPIRESYLGRLAFVKNKNLREQLELKEKYEIIDVLRDGEGALIAWLDVPPLITEQDNGTNHPVFINLNLLDVLD